MNKEEINTLMIAHDVFNNKIPWVKYAFFEFYRIIRKTKRGVLIGTMNKQTDPGSAVIMKLRND